MHERKTVRMESENASLASPDSQGNQSSGQISLLKLPLALRRIQAAHALRQSARCPCLQPEAEGYGIASSIENDGDLSIRQGI